MALFDLTSLRFSLALNAFNRPTVWIKDASLTCPAPPSSPLEVAYSDFAEKL